MSAVSFAAMGLDKYRAVKNGWRIRERTLLLLSFLGGGIGAILGMLVFRHKIRHGKFLLLVPASIAVNAAGWWMIVRLLEKI